MFALLAFTPFTGKRTDKMANLVCNASMRGAVGGPLDGVELSGLTIWRQDNGSFSVALPKANYKPVIGPKRVVTEDVEGFSISGQRQVTRLQDVISRIYTEAVVESDGTPETSVYNQTFDLASALGSQAAKESA